MKKITLSISILALFNSIFSLFKIQNPSELVYVDVNKLLEGYKRTKIVSVEFQLKAKTLNTNVDSLVSNWKNELKSYENERSKMSKKEIELKQQLLGNEQQQLNKKTDFNK